MHHNTCELDITKHVRPSQANCFVFKPKTVTQLLFPYSAHQDHQILLSSAVLSLPYIYEILIRK
jgi:hypothetical protein